MACMNNEDKVPLCTRKFLSAGLISMQLLTSWAYMGFVSWMITWIALLIWALHWAVWLAILVFSGHWNLIVWLIIAILFMVWLATLGHIWYNCSSRSLSPNNLCTNIPANFWNFFNSCSCTSAGHFSSTGANANYALTYVWICDIPDLY